MLPYILLAMRVYQYLLASTHVHSARREPPL